MYMRLFSTSFVNYLTLIFTGNSFLFSQKICQFLQAGHYVHKLVGDFPHLQLQLNVTNDHPIFFYAFNTYSILEDIPKMDLKERKTEILYFFKLRLLL